VTEILEAAVAYLPRTVPLAPGSKRPSVGEGWPNWRATSESVATHYAAHPDDGVGIRTGNGLVGLDVDRRSGGFESLERLERELGPLPPTPEVVTGAEGRHRYFRASPDIASSLIAPGLELKAAGSQLVAPPTHHPLTGRVYCWDPAHPLIEDEIAPLPDAWLEQLVSRAPADSGAELGDLAKRDPLHRIPSATYVERLTGRSVNRQGYIACPLHGGGRELVPSLKVYPAGGWKCYGCDVGGRIYQLAGLLGGYTLPLTRSDRQAIRAELVREFAEELLAA